MKPKQNAMMTITKTGIAIANRRTKIKKSKLSHFLADFVGVLVVAIILSVIVSTKSISVLNFRIFTKNVCILIVGNCPEPNKCCR
jgi:hypothetical protein